MQFLRRVNDQTQYLKFIKSLLKDQPYVELAYLTGILPIAKYSSGSELNMFLEYNFMNDYIYEAFFGLSEEEVRKLCEDNKSVSYEELKYWYDGDYPVNGEVDVTKSRKEKHNPDGTGGAVKKYRGNTRFLL